MSRPRDFARHRTRRKLCLSLFTSIGLLAGSFSIAAPAMAQVGASPDIAANEPQKESPEVDNDTCLGCHADADIEAESPRGKKLKLVVREDANKGTPHEDLSCTDCHTGAQSFEDVPHNAGKPLTLGCASCHEDVANEYRASIHGGLRAMGDKAAATCSDCHGRHNILPPSDRRSRVNKFNLSKTCAVCHEGGAMLKTHKVDQEKPVSHYIDSIHGRALLVDGLNVAPSCNDCHGVHDILPHENPQSHISKSHVPDTCGRCHVLVEEVYNKSVHGKLLLAGDKRGPTCIDCHTSHEIGAPRRAEFKLSIDHKCGGCHADMLERYRETFHGKAIALGRQGVAACYDCHGHHDILPASDTASHISAKNRLATCRNCHPNANKNFANYLVHASHTDKAKAPQVYYVYVFMTALLLGTFLFFAVHTLLWMFRSLMLYIFDSKTFREAKLKTRDENDEQFVRFKPVDRFIHGVVIFSFLLLVLTGMPLKFYYTDWAQLFLDFMGGQAVAAILHRVGAILTLFYFTLHVLVVAGAMWRNRSRFHGPNGKFSLLQFAKEFFGPESPAPNLQDLRDFWAHQKWFFGKGPRPQFDRWTYWEKFDYLAVFWGVAVIGLSGLIMWFPESFTTLLPGWIINIALVIHSDEALLAAGFIFTFHFFNVHFRIEKFPMDPIIFSGRISKAELLHERKRQYERWKKEGTLDDHRLKDEWMSWKRIALPAGFAAFLTGVVLVVLIFAAMYARLLQH